MDFIEELRWRGMIHDMMPGTEEQLKKEMTTAYVGIDPTADSLHIGHLCGVMMLRHFQRCGHKPLALIGGATGMIGDPSGKSQERNLLTEEILRHNVACIKEQLSRFLNFDGDSANCAELVNNYDWMKDFTFLDFAREVGKHITVNYMMAKDSVKKRLNGEARDGLSFTEFTYQLLQGYDFLHLNATGNVWLSAEYTSPYKFCQFWLNVSDADAEKYIKIFTFIGKEECEALIEEHRAAPHLRLLQKRLAKDVTIMVHSEEDYNKAMEAAGILFGNASQDQLAQLDEKTFLDVFEGVPTFEISKEALSAGIRAVDLLTDHAAVFPSKGEMRKMAQGGGVAINKEKLAAFDAIIDEKALLNGKYILAQRGKKNYFLLIAK